MKRSIQYVAVLQLLLLTLLTACAAVSELATKTFNEQLAVGYTTVTAIRTTTTSLLTAKKISADDAQNVQNSANVLRTGLDVARNLSTVDLKSAQGKLSATLTALNALQTYLASKGSK